jgi:hypothetical protein
VTIHVEVEWCDRNGRRSRSVAEDADAALQALRRVDVLGEPVLVDFIQPGGRSLTVGVGRDLSVLCFQSSPDGPNFSSVGTDDGAALTYFWYGGEQSEFGGRQLVSKEAAESALREFMGTGDRPSAVKWDRV